MNLKEYQEQAKRTCASLGDEKLNLSHMVLGIISEQEEFLKAIVDDDMVNAREEQADICWYVANYCTFREYNLSEIVSNPYELSFDIEEHWMGEVSTFDMFCSKLADYVKKFIAYGKEIDRKLEREALEAIVVSMSYEDTGFDLEKDLQKNIDKLKQRYPDKFTTENALNRDLDAERKILES